MLNDTYILQKGHRRLRPDEAQKVISECPWVNLEGIHVELVSIEFVDTKSSTMKKPSRHVGLSHHRGEKHEYYQFHSP